MNRKYRKTVIAGNWKMNKTPSETKEFMTQLKAIMPKGRWCDIALCYRSLSHNYSGRYKPIPKDTVSDYDDMLLFRELGIAPDWEKIRYYILLDELF